MKSTLVLSFLVTTAFSSMIGTLHDLSDGTAIVEEELCIYCHVTDLYADTNTTFPIYGQDENTSSQFIDATLSCLGCHDGVSAAYQAIYSVENKVYLDRMHPVAITYNQEKRTLKNISTPLLNWQNATIIDDILVNGKLQCVTCHNPHNNDNGRFLRHNNKGSKLCISCHQMSASGFFP